MLDNLVLALFHPSVTVRIGGKYALRELSSVLHLDESLLLLPVKDKINIEIDRKLQLHASIGSIDVDEGGLSGLTYCLHLKPTLVISSSLIISTITAALLAAEANEIPVLDPLSLYAKESPSDEASFSENYLLELEMHPFPMPTSVVRRLQFIRLTHALCAAASVSSSIAETMLLITNKAPLLRGSSLLFQSLNSPVRDIGMLSQRALRILNGLKDAPTINVDDYEAIYPK